MASPRAIGTTLRKVSWRPALHLLSALVPVSYAYGAGRPLLLVLLGSGVAAALAVELMRRVSEPARTVFDRWAGPLLRDYERGGLTAATWLAISLLAATVLLPRAPAVAAMWCVTAGDPAAALAGTAWRARSSASSLSGRTVAGSLVLIGVSSLGATVLAGFTPAGAIAISVVAALTERAGGRVNDNVTIMIGAALTALAVS